MLQAGALETEGEAAGGLVGDVGVHHHQAHEAVENSWTCQISRSRRSPL